MHNITTSFLAGKSCELFHCAEGARNAADLDRAVLCEEDFRAGDICVVFFRIHVSETSTSFQLMKAIRFGREEPRAVENEF